MVTTFPAYASPEEMGMQVALEAERSFNNIFMTTGIRELQSFDESGILTEAKNKKSFKDTIIGWLNSIFEGIKKIWDKILKFIKDQSNKVKNKIREIAKGKESQLKSKAERMLKDDKTYGKVHTWPGFNDVIASSISGPVGNTCKMYERKIEQVMDDAKSYKEVHEDDVTNYNRVIAGRINEIEDEVKKQLNITEVTSSAIGAGVKKIIAGEEKDLKKKYIIDNWAELYKYATDFGETASRVKGNINNVKKKFDNCKKEVEALAKGYKDTVLAGAVKVIKKEALFLNYMSSAAVSSVKLRCNEASMIVLRVAIGIAKKEEKKDKAVGESAIVPTAFQTELTSLFDI